MRSVRVCVILLAVLNLAVVAQADLVKPRVPHSAWVVGCGPADPMFTPLREGACPARAVKIGTRCLWCPPEYHGHVWIKGDWMCYRCKGKNKADLRGVVVIYHQEFYWCVKCRSGFRWNGRACSK